MAAIGVAQEFQRVWSAADGQTSTGTPRWSLYKADRRVTRYYFYLWDADFGPAFVKICAYFPYPGKVWINGHEWAKRQATKAGTASQLRRLPGPGGVAGHLRPVLPLALTELGLIDEYEFVVHPWLAGHGPTLFAGLSTHLDLKLLSRLEFDSGAVAMWYKPRR